MHDERDEREQQQKVNQTSGHMEREKSHRPHHQQNKKQNKQHLNFSPRLRIKQGSSQCAGKRIIKAWGRLRLTISPRKAATGAEASADEPVLESRIPLPSVIGSETQRADTEPRPEGAECGRHNLPFLCNLDSAATDRVSLRRAESQWRNWEKLQSGTR
jgi:hypothetical protein